MNVFKQCIFLGAPLLLTGCGQSSAVREYEVEREVEDVLTSELIRDQFKPSPSRTIPFQWQVPKDWEAQENDEFSASAWAVGPTGASARITVSDLPGTAGIEPQFSRWRGQLQLPEIDSAELMKSVETIAAKGVTGQWIEITGDSETILGMLVPYKENLWVLKYRSSNSTARDHRAAFRSFCESLEVK